MKIRDYIKDKGVFLIVNFIIFLVITISMIFYGISFIFIFILGCIWFLPLLSYMAIDYIKFKRYFSNIESILENLDKKFLFPELLEKETFGVGEKFNEVLKEISRGMYEHLKYYKDIQIDYREYIEMWVHEIKTPIASTKLLIENNNSNETVKKIDNQINKIEGFVEQVLYYSRSDDVEKDYIIKEIDLNEVVKGVIKRNSRDFINKKIKLKLENIYETVYCDSKWIEFILNQIIVNAIKYSKNKGAIISVKSIELNNSIVLIIEDNGVGIDERDILRVFEKGFTGGNGRVFGKSTGLGLYLCKKMCDRLGVGLEIKSKVDKGTEVNIIFPKCKVIAECKDI